MRVVEGTDTGQSRFLIGYFKSPRSRKSLVAIGMTPMETIVRGDPRRRLDRPPRHRPGGARQERRLHRARRQFRMENISNTRRIDKVFLRGQEVPRAAMAAKWQAQFGRQRVDAVGTGFSACAHPAPGIEPRAA